MSDSRPPHSYHDWETLIGFQSSCDEEMASVLRFGVIEPSAIPMTTRLVKRFIERTLSSEKDRFLAALEDLESDFDGFELATKRFLVSSRYCLAPLECEGMPEDFANELTTEVEAYVSRVIESVRKAVRFEESEEAEYIMRKAQRLWRR